MNNITYKYGCEISKNHVLSLYEDAGWTSYTKDMPKLKRAIESSLMVISAWKDNELLGLIRVVGDGLTIIYIQDILVKKAYRRSGIGSKLLEYVLENYKEVRQKVLLTDDEESTRRFYEANGFTSCDKGIVVAFAKLN